MRESFDAYGARRGPAWSGAPSSGDLATINGLTRRDYTGHEMLDSTGLIHMNGRVQDPLLGRFVSADPFLDVQFGTQAWNRFAYVGNNPLTFSDPSGFTSLGSAWPHVALLNGDQHPSVDVEIVMENGLETVMAYGRRESSISLDLVQLMEVPHPGGGRGGDGGGGGIGGGGASNPERQKAPEAPEPDNPSPCQSIGPPIAPNQVTLGDAVDTADALANFAEPLVDLGIATTARQAQSLARIAGRTFAVTGVVTSLYTAYRGYQTGNNSDLSWGIVDAGMSAVAFSGFGAPVAAVYFSSRFAFEFGGASMEPPPPPSTCSSQEQEGDTVFVVPCKMRYFSPGTCPRF